MRASEIIVEADVDRHAQKLAKDYDARAKKAAKIFTGSLAREVFDKLAHHRQQYQRGLLSQEDISEIINKKFQAATRLDPKHSSVESILSDLAATIHRNQAKILDSNIRAEIQPLVFKALRTALDQSERGRRPEVSSREVINQVSDSLINLLYGTVREDSNESHSAKIKKITTFLQNGVFKHYDEQYVSFRDTIDKIVSITNLSNRENVKKQIVDLLKPMFAELNKGLTDQQIQRNYLKVSSSLKEIEPTSMPAIPVPDAGAVEVAVIPKAEDGSPSNYVALTQNGEWWLFSDVGLGYKLETFYEKEEQAEELIKLLNDRGISRMKNGSIQFNQKLNLYKIKVA
jgi:hypothetical protein